MRSFSQRRVFALVSLTVLCVASAVVAIYFYRNAPFVPLPIGQKMPILPAMTIDGQTYVQDTTDGKKSLVVFFMPGCSHCRRELMNLNELLPNYADKLDILGISVDNITSTKTMMAELNLKFPVVVADNKKLKEVLEMNILPAFFCLDGTRVLKKYYTGEHSLTMDEHLIEDFISSSNTP